MYESSIAWRYLFRPRITRGRIIAMLLAALVAVAGAWIQSSVQGMSYVGAAMLAGGGLVAVIMALTLMFSMFTTVSVLAVFFAVATMVLVRSVTMGFSQEFKDKVLGFNAHVLVMRWGFGLTEYRRILKDVKQLPHVTGAAPFTIADMLVARGSEHTHVLMKGILPETVREVLDLEKYVQVKSSADLRQKVNRIGKHLDKGLVGAGYEGGCECKRDEDGDCIPGSRQHCQLPGIMIGTRLAARLKVKEGEIVRLISPTAEIQKLRTDVQKTGPPVARDFRIVGLFYCGFEEYDQKLVFVHLKAAQKFINPGSGPEEDSVLGVEIKLDDIYKAGEVARMIEQRLGGSPYRVITWMQLNKPLFSALRTQKIIMIVISLILLFVAAFCILAALAMMVIDKTKEVAILRSMGVSSGGVARVFLMVSLIIGALGALLGVLFGLTMCDSLSRLNFPLDPKVYLISRLPVLVDYLEIAWIGGGTLFLCFVAALYPAYRASLLDPVEGLRYE